MTRSWRAYWMLVKIKHSMQIIAQRRNAKPVALLLCVWARNALPMSFYKCYMYKQVLFQSTPLPLFPMKTQFMSPALLLLSCCIHFLLVNIILHFIRLYLFNQSYSVRQLWAPEFSRMAQASREWSGTDIPYTKVVRGLVARDCSSWLPKSTLSIGGCAMIAESLEHGSASK